MRGISDELRKCGAETGLRSGPLEHDDIKDLYLVEPVELGREELAALLDGSVYNGIVIVRERMSGRFDFKRYW